MKLATIALASVFALSSTFALAATSHHKKYKSGASTQQGTVGMGRSMNRTNQGTVGMGRGAAGGPNNRGGLVGGDDPGTYKP
jgi:hypothetical protein